MNYTIYSVILYFIGPKLQNKIMISTLNMKCHLFRYSTLYRPNFTKQKITTFLDMKHAIYSVILHFIGPLLSNKNI